MPDDELNQVVTFRLSKDQRRLLEALRGEQSAGDFARDATLERLHQVAGEQLGRKTSGPAFAGPLDPLGDT